MAKALFYLQALSAKGWTPKQKNTGRRNGVIVVGGRMEEFTLNLAPHLYQYIVYGSSPELEDQHKPEEFADFG